MLERKVDTTCKEHNAFLENTALSALLPVKHISAFPLVAAHLKPPGDSLLKPKLSPVRARQFSAHINLSNNDCQGGA